MKKKKNAKHNLLAKAAHHKVITARTSEHKKVVMVVRERTILLSMTHYIVVKVSLLVVGAKKKEERHQKILFQPHQMALSPWPTDSTTSYGNGQQYGHSHHDPSYEYGQHYGGYSGPSHGYGQQQYGIIMVPPQQPLPHAYPFPVGQFGGQYISSSCVNFAMVIQTHQITDKVLQEGGKASLILI